MLAPSLAGLIPDPALVPWAAGLAIGLIAVIALSLAAHYLAKALHFEGMGAIDRSLGFLFGLARGAFLIIQWALDEQRYPNWLSEAKSLPMARTGADLLVRLMPAHLRPGLGALNAEAQDVAKGLVLERLVSPPVKSGAPKPGSGYTAAERAVMNRVVKELQ